MKLSCTTGTPIYLSVPQYTPDAQQRRFLSGAEACRSHAPPTAHGPVGPTGASGREFSLLKVVVEGWLCWQQPFQPALWCPLSGVRGVLSFEGHLPDVAGFPCSLSGITSYIM